MVVVYLLGQLAAAALIFGPAAITADRLFHRHQLDERAAKAIVLIAAAVALVVGPLGGEVALEIAR